MPWGSLSGAQQILVRLYMTGGPQYEAQMVKAGLATRAMSRDTVALDKALKGATQRTWLQNQALFTARRFLFYTTLGVIGLGAAVAKMGFDFNAQMQSAQVAFKGFLGSTRAAQKETRALYVIAAETPFEFQDLVVGARRLQMFTGNVKVTNMVIEDISNSLSAMGITSGAAFNRASLALAHMFAIGRLTGQVLYQLARDNIPMQKALQYHFHATGEEIKNAVSKGLIDANTAAVALHDYILSNKGLRNAGIRMSLNTFSGAWATFKDVIRLGAGSGQMGAFNKLTSIIVGIDKALIPLLKGGRPITLHLIAEAIDKELTPASHMFLNTFLFFQGAVEGLVGTFVLLYKAIDAVLSFFGPLINMFGAAGSAAKTLGRIVGVLTALFILQRTVLFGLKVAADLYRASLWFLKPIIITITSLEQRKIATEMIGNLVGGANFGGLGGGFGRWRKWAGATKYKGAVPAHLRTVNPAFPQERIKPTAVWANEGRIARLSRALLGLTAAEEAAAAGGAAAAAGVLWPVAIVASVVLLIGLLVLLYYRWKRFHDLVNRTFDWIKRNAVPIAVMLGQMFAPLGVAAGAVILLVNQFHRLKDAIKAVVDAWHKLPAFLRQPLSKTLHLGALGGPGGRVARTAFNIARPHPFAGMRGYHHGESFPHWLGQHALHMIPGYGIGSRIAGLFQMGGTVPGPVGSPQLIMAHGGEKVTPLGAAQWDRISGDGKPIHVHVMVDRKEIAAAVARANQDYASRR